MLDMMDSIQMMHSKLYLLTKQMNNIATRFGGRYIVFYGIVHDIAPAIYYNSKNDPLRQIGRMSFRFEGSSRS